MKFIIRNMNTLDWPSVSRIYQEGIDTRLATFEMQVPHWDVWHSNHLKHPRFVIETDVYEEIAGWAALSPVSKREVYAGVAEVSIYIAEKYQRKGAGRLLLTELIHASEDAGFWTLTATIMAENKASITLHQQCGFRFVGKRDKIACLDGEWRDTIIFERRSNSVGK